MKKSLLLYVTIIALLLNVFTYMYYTKQAEFEKLKFEKVTKKLKDSIAITNEIVLRANYFALENNDNAKNYLETASENPVNFEKFIPYVTDCLLEFNSNPKGNPYTGQEQISANKFIINKIKVLNHRWIIADFSDGEYWGEVVLKYFINEDHSLSFEVSESVLYQKAVME